MKYKIFVAVMGLLLAVGGVMIALGVANVRRAAVAPEQRGTLAQPAQSAPIQNSDVQLAGAYSGAVKLDVTVGGVYSDTLATPPPPGAGTPTPPDLGSIGLSLQLSQSGNALSGYVDLDKTLVYSAEHTLGAGASSIKIGPYVSGVFDGANLTLQSEKVSFVVNGRTVQRQFRLTGTSAASDGGQVTGEYRETVWGYTNAPVTVIGAFALQRPSFDSTVPGSNNEAPNAVSDTAMTMQGVAVTIDVLANDTDAGGDALTITSVSKPQFGTATTDGQTVTYTPDANFAGKDGFSYVVSDGKGGVATGSVTIRVRSSEGEFLYLPIIKR